MRLAAITIIIGTIKHRRRAASQPCYPPHQAAASRALAGGPGNSYGKIMLNGRGQPILSGLSAWLPPTLLLGLFTRLTGYAPAV